jgi:hypothetical protein
MNRQEASENLAAAVVAAYRAGMEPWEIQDAIGHGSHDAGKLSEASAAATRAAELLSPTMETPPHHVPAGIKRVR